MFKFRLARIKARIQYIVKPNKYTPRRPTHHNQLILSEFRRNAKGNNEATIADRLLKIINLKRLKLPWSQSEPSLPTTAVIIPENPAKATDISAIDNNTSRFSVIKLSAGMEIVCSLKIEFAHQIVTQSLASIPRPL